MPAKLKRIQARAFSNCFSLEQIDMPDTSEYLGEAAFLNCRSLESVVVPGGITDIRLRTFRNCHNLKRITLPETFCDTSIGYDIFKDNDKAVLTVRAPERVIALLKQNGSFPFSVNYEVIEI